MPKPSFLQCLLNGLGAARAGKSPPSVEFEETLRKTLDQQEDDGRGLVYLIELDSLRRQFGKKWDLIAGNIHETVRGTVESHMSATDACTPYTDTSYLVVYARSSRREIQLKCSLIARELARKLIGTEAAYNEIRIKRAAVDDAGRIAFNEVADIGTAVNGPSDRPSVKDERRLIAEPQLWTDDVIDRDGIRFIYRPLLTLRGMVVSTYICLAVKQDSAGFFFSGYELLPDPFNALQITDLDLLTLATAATELSCMAETGTKALLSLPVHFETIANNRNRTRHIDYCRKHLKKYADRLVFELVGLPEGVPQVRLVELVGMLRPLARAVIARFMMDRKSFDLCRSAGLHAVGVDIHYCREDEASVMRQFNRFAEAANKERLKTYVHGIHTISLNTAAIAAGFDYVDGYAITSVAKSPMSARRYDLHSMYRPLLGKAG